MTEGQQVAGRYVLRRHVASGGMAAVWEAEDTVLGRSVAIKVLHPHLAGDPEFVSRFRAEAKAAARLSHQSIVAIYDTASEGGVEAIVMELIDGITLREYLDEYGTLSLDDAADLATQVAAALDAAHKARIVHRDIKPGNIILCADRRVKVTDFGIAKALEDGDATSHGTLLGTAKYLAPEQVEGLTVDERADIYSLGVVMYEGLTGHPPFAAENDSATALARLRTDPRPLREIEPSVPVAVEGVVLKALARDRANRYRTAGAFGEALSHAVANPAPEVDPTATIDLTTSATVPEVAPVPSAEAAAPAPRRRSLAAPLFVSALIVASLALGVGLILATSAGRDFFDRLFNNQTDQPGNGDSASGPEAAPPPAAGNDTALNSPEPVDANTDARPPDGPAPSEASSELEMSLVSDFDPAPGDGIERSDRIGLLLDRDLATKWTSEGYDTRKFGNLKDGVGIILVLNERETLTELSATSPTQGWAASVHVADAAGATLADWGEPLDARVNIAGDTTFDLRGVRGQAVLLWITDLGDAPPRLRIEIAELALR